MLEKVLQARILKNVGALSIADVISTEADEVNRYMARFAPVSVGDVKEYNGEVEWDAAAVTPIELTLTEKEYFAFGVDDVEALKTYPERIDRASRTQARKLSAKEDTFLLDVLAKGAGKSITRTLSSPEKAYEAVVDANKELSKLDAPFEDRFIIVSHDVLGMLEKDDRFTRDYEVLSNGIVEGASVNGSKLIVTNYLPEDTILAVQKEGVGFARFLDKIETMRLQSAFADGVRGITVFDGVVLEDACVVKVTTKGATETK